MSQPDKAKPAQAGFSMVRPLLLVLLGGAIVFGWSVFEKFNSARQQQESSDGLANAVFPLSNPTKNRLADEFTDANDDLVADAPTDASEQLTPESLSFSFIAGEDAEKHKTLWQPLMERLAEATGREVEYFAAKDVDEQLKALKERKLHITCLNTGAVPVAVNVCGFVPISALGRADGSFGYSMQIIVPADSPIDSVEDLREEVEDEAGVMRKRRVTFTNRKSNSGFKAPVVILYQDYELTPSKDYEWGFSTSHEESIKRVALGEIEAAPVASDLIERIVATDDAISTESFRTVFTSSTFPSACFGCLSQLEPELAAKVREVLVGFSFAGTPLEEEFAGSGDVQLVGVDYQKDWSEIRRIDDALGHVHKVD